jgi:orotidine-5'-phosphate decarboxylase
MVERAVQPFERLVLPLDLSSKQEALAIVDELKGIVGIFKVGFQLFSAVGPEVVAAIREKGGEVFLDLKYHDIPNTVKQAGLECQRLGVKMFNVHASGGRRMMEECAKAVRQQAAQGGGTVPLMLAVTVLTSTNQESLSQELGVQRDMQEQVSHLALLARDSGMDGVVCSAREAKELRQVCGKNFILLTPGVRPAGADKGDQERVATPAEAIAWGADFLVIGRPIIQATDRRAAAQAIVDEIKQAQG